MTIHGRFSLALAAATLSAALCGTAASGGVERIDEVLADEAALAALEAGEARDTCYPLTQRYAALAQAAYPKAPDFAPQTCTTATGRRVVMQCAPTGPWKEALEGRIAAPFQAASAPSLEYACRTAPVQAALRAAAPETAADRSAPRPPHN